MSAYAVGLINEVAINAILAYSVYIILLTGQLSLGNSGFMALGAYVVALLTVKMGVALGPALFLGGITAGVVGVLVVGIPSLRLRDVFLALATLAFAQIVQTFFQNFSPTGGAQGFSGLTGVSSGVVLALFAATFALVVYIERSRIFLAFRAIRDDEDAALFTGVPTTVFKVMAFGIGAFVAAVGGGLFAENILYVTPDAFGFMESVNILLAVVLGGQENAFGPLLGAIVFTLLPVYLRFLADWRYAVYGLLLLAILIARPRGILPAMSWRRLFFRERADKQTSEPTMGQRGTKVLGAEVPLLELKGVRRTFGGVTAVDGVDINLPAGQILGLIGPNGAGKTTVFNIITGAVAPSSGSVYLGGENVTGEKPGQLVRAGIARTFQNIRLFKGLTVREHVELSYYLACGRPHWWSARQIGPDGRAEVMETLALLHLAELSDRMAVELPYATQRRVEIARALIQKPRLLLLDEPGAGMNPSEKHELMGVLEKVAGFGVTLLLVEHDMDIVMNVCDRIVVLNFGRPIAFGSPEEIQKDPAVTEAYMGKGWAVRA